MSLIQEKAGGISYKLGKNSVIEFVTWNGVDYIDIHEVDTSDIDTRGRKGAALTLSKWAWVRFNINSINDYVNHFYAPSHQCDMRLHVGYNWCVSVTMGIRCVDIRQWYMYRRRTLKPGRNGIALRVPEWQKLVEIVPEMNSRSSKLENANICFHENQQGRWLCSECCPNDLV